jgi:hypothetical protein
MFIEIDYNPFSIFFQGEMFNLINTRPSFWLSHGLPGHSFAGTLPLPQTPSGDPHHRQRSFLFQPVELTATGCKHLILTPWIRLG